MRTPSRVNSARPRVNTLEATLMMNKEGAGLVDLRDDADFAKGHVLNAVNIPMAQLESRLGELSKFKDKPLIVYCDAGNRSGAALDILKKNGFDKAFNLGGGIAAWQQAGLPLEK